MAGNDLPPGGQPFSVPRQLRLDATGYQYITITVPSGVLWRVLFTSVSTSETSQTVNPPLVKIYRGESPSAAAFLEQTFSGNGATSDTLHVLTGGQALTAEWTGGTPLSLATFRLTGMQYNLN